MQSARATALADALRPAGDEPDYKSADDQDEETEDDKRGGGSHVGRDHSPPGGAVTPLPVEGGALPVIEFVTRRDCPLCDDAEDLLVAWGGELGFSIETRDVDADPALLDRFGSRVPVARTKDGLIVAEGRWSEEAAKEALGRYIGSVRPDGGPEKGRMKGAGSGGTKIDTP